MLNIAIQHHWQAQALLIEEKDSVFFFFFFLFSFTL